MTDLPKPRFIKRYPDRGIDRLYFRKRGHPRSGEPLQHPWPQTWAGSPLKAEVEAILGPPHTGARPSNLAGAIRAYELSANFRALAPDTRYNYILYIKELEADGLAALGFTAFTPALLLEMRDIWAVTRGHQAANHRLQLLKNVLEPQLIAQNLADPFARIPAARRPHDAGEPHALWTDEVFSLVMAEAVRRRWYGLARATAIARYAGARRGDLARLTAAARPKPGAGHAARIAWLSGKRKVPVNMPEDPLLTHWLTRLPAIQPLSKWQRHRQRKRQQDRAVIPLPHRRLVYNTRGQPFTPGGLGQAMADVVAHLHQARAIDSAAYDLHGLRHTFGVEAALAGCTDAQGAALLGHHSPSSFAIYRRQAQRLTLSDAGAALIAALRQRLADPSTPAAAAAQEHHPNESV